MRAAPSSVFRVGSASLTFSTALHPAPHAANASNAKARREKRDIMIYLLVCYFA
jgi:hypothetical protein